MSLDSESQQTLDVAAKAGQPQPTSKAPPTSSARTLLWSVLMITVVGVVVAWAWTLGGAVKLDPESGPLPVIAQVPDFQMTGQEGQPVSRQDLMGTVWVADFIFTDCPGPCPKLSARMLHLQRMLDKRKLPAKLVSFTLDPKRDQPPVLRHYAKRFKADPARWIFITNNDESAMHKLIIEGFLQTVMPGDDSHPFEHSAYFMIVDAEGRIRAAHHGLDPNLSIQELTDHMLSDIEKLIAENTAA